MAITNITPGDGEDPAGKMAEFFGPAQIDHQIRQAIQLCWYALPKDKKNIAELESQIRRIVERALKDFREDAAAFGKTL